MAQSDTATGSSIYENLRRLITVVDDLRDVGLQQYISLPSIVVVGTQSAGKSSVLESVVGLDFLPRGDGVVTRRPLELRMVHISPGDERATEGQPWGVFDDEKGKKYLDFEEVRAAIARRTDQVAGANKGIVDDPIKLTIYGEMCPDLTLIDLPGITRVPASGSDQTEDVEQITKDMASRYIRDERSIILAVMSANVDMTTSDALQLARQYDREGIRTIGVLTKIDIMDRGTNAKKALLGQEVPLKLGFVGIVNRSQQDIKDGKKVKEAIASEAKFFGEHPVYNALPSGHTGAAALTDKLTHVLFGHIKHFLPTIQKEINSKTTEVDEALKALGEPVPVTSDEITQALWNMVTSFCEMYRAAIRGSYDRRLHGANVTNLDPKALSGGAKVRFIMNQLLVEYQDTSQSITQECYSDTDIETAIRIHEGDTLPGFPSVDVFEYLVRPLLEKLREPIFECLAEVHASLDTLANSLLNKVFKRFPELHSEAIEIVTAILNNELEKTREVVEATVAAEEGYIFTNDQAYISQRTRQLKTLDGDEQQLSMQISPEEAFVQEMRARLDAYFAVVVRNVRDSIPKAIGHFLVRAVMEKMQFEFHSAIQSDPRLGELLTEPDSIAEERAALTKQLQTLRNATRVLRRDPQLARLQAELRDEQLLVKQEEQKKAAQPAAATTKAKPPPQPLPTAAPAQPSMAQGGAERQRQPYQQGGAQPQGRQPPPHVQAPPPRQPQPQVVQQPGGGGSRAKATGGKSLFDDEDDPLA